MYGKFKTRLDAFLYSYIPPILFLKIVFLVPKVFNSLIFNSEAMFYENYLASDFHTNTVISRRVCLLVKMASKTAQLDISVAPLRFRRTNFSFLKCSKWQDSIVNVMKLELLTMVILIQVFVAGTATDLG